MNAEQRLRMAGSAANARERALLQSLDRIANSLDYISETLSIMYGRKFEECDPLGTLAEMALVPEGTKAEVRERQ